MHGRLTIETEITVEEEVTSAGERIGWLPVPMNSKIVGCDVRHDCQPKVTREPKPQRTGDGDWCGR